MIVTLAVFLIQSLYRISGKTIVPFTAHAGSRDGGIWQETADLVPDAILTEVLAVSGERAGDAESAVCGCAFQTGLLTE